MKGQPAGPFVKPDGPLEQHLIYHKHGLPKPYQCNLNDLLNAATFVQAIPRVICSKLHSLRIHGNKGAHGESVLPQTAVWLLQEAYELGRWMHLGYANGSKADCPAFSPPSPANGTEAERRLKQEKVSILQRLAAQEAEMQRVLAELEGARSKVQVAEATVTELQAAQAKGQQVADALAFDEETMLRRFDATTKDTLLHEIAPLMQWRNVAGNEAAHQFDLLVCRLQAEYLKQSSSFADPKAELLDQIGDLGVNLSQVKAVAPAIAQDTLSNSFPERFPKAATGGFDVILANPPFKGSLDESDVHPSLTGKVKTKKTELLFVALFLRMLKDDRERYAPDHP